MNSNISKIFGVILLLLISGLSIYVLSEKWEIDESTCEGMVDEKEQGKCFYDLAIVKGDEVFCRKIEEVLDKDRCHYELAVLNSDFDLCSRAGDDEESCYKEILRRADNDMCEEIENRYRKEKCYYYLAIINDDLDLCDKTGERKEACREEISGEFHKPDLRISGFGYSPTRPKKGDRIKFTIFVENIGEKKANRFSVLVETFSSKGEARVTSLEVDQRKRVDIEVPAIKAGNLLFKIKVDSRNEINESNEENNKKEKSIYILEEVKCTDSDGGRDYYVKGKTTIGSSQFEDKCSRSTLTGNYDGVHEYYCRPGNILGHVMVKCSHGCNNGECFGELTVPQCIDKDGGENIYVASTASGEYGSSQGDCCVRGSAGGSCVPEGSYLREGICKSNPGIGEWVFTGKIINCPNGCKNGACIRSE